MTNNDETTNTRRKVNGCGMVAAAIIGVILLAFAAVAVFILFNFGVWLGDQ